MKYNTCLTYYNYIYSYRKDSDYGNGQGYEIPITLTLDDWSDVEDNAAIALDKVILETGFETEGSYFTAEFLGSDVYNQFGNDPYDGKDYSNLKKHGFGLIKGIVNKQNDDVSQETYFDYHTGPNRRRSIKEIITKKSDNGGTNTEWMTTSFSYDETYNNLTSITDPKGNVLTLSYDSTNHAYIVKDSRTIDMDNRSFDGCKIVNEFDYDDLGRMDWKRTYYEESGSPKAGYASDFTHYTYDDLNRITYVKTSTTEQGTKTTRMTYTYDDTNHYMEAKDPIDNKIKKYYDGLDRVIKEEAFKSTSTQVSKKEYEYHPIFKDRVEKTTIYKNSEHTSTHIIETLYDTYERPVSREVNDKLVKGISYDDLNNLITEIYLRDNETFPTFSMKRMDMDWNGNTVKIKEWAMLKPDPLYDSAVITEYTYDLAGNCISMENDSGEEFKYKYNTLGQLYKTIYDDSTCETFTYDTNGNMTEKVDRKGNTLEYVYDTINMLRTEKTYNSSQTLTYTTETDYGQYGTPVVIEGIEGSNTLYRKEYTYNGLGLLTDYHQFDQYVNSSTYEKHYLLENTYDAAGNLDVSSLSEGTVGSETLIKALDYDPVDQDTLSENAAIASVWEYTTSKQDRIVRIRNKYWGGIQSIKYGDDGSPPRAYFTTTYSYNNFLQPTGIQGTKSTAGDLMDLVYTYDFQGNVTSWENESTPVYYAYDGMDRLEKEDNNSDFSSPESVYYYDGIGNRLGIDHGNNSKYDDSGDEEYFYTDTYNKMQLVKIEDGPTIEWDFEYDDNGNMIQKDNNDDEYWFYEYDEKNRLEKVILSDDSTKGDGDDVIKGEYLYDSAGLRIKKIENSKTTIYIYSGESILFEETFNTDDQDELDNSTYYESREYNVELNGLKVAKYKGTYSSGWSYVLEFHLLDHLGSRQVVTDDDGDVVSGGDVEYGTFGEYDGGAEGEYSYTGKQRDSGTGLSYFNARYYDPAIGRFITVDPIRDGINWYVYCRNNPLKFVDPNGLDTLFINMPGLDGWELTDPLFNGLADMRQSHDDYHSGESETGFWWSGIKNTEFETVESAEELNNVLSNLGDNITDIVLVGAHGTPESPSIGNITPEEITVKIDNSINVYDASCYQGNYADTWASAFGVDNFYGLNYQGWAHLTYEMIKDIISGKDPSKAFDDYASACDDNYNYNSKACDEWDNYNENLPDDADI